MGPIVLKLTDGLGNQLFQYAFALMKAEGDPSMIEIDTQWYDSSNNNLRREPLLRALKINSTFLTHAESKSRRPWSLWAPAMLSSWNSLVEGVPIFRETATDCITNAHSWHPEWLGGSPKAYIWGYFCSHHYVDSIRSQFLRETTQNFHPSDEVHRIADKLKEGQAVCVAIREADFLHSQSGILPKTYYQNAIAFMRSKLPDARFFLFGDTPTSEFLSDLPIDRSIIKLNLTTLDQFFLLQQFQHFVLANSTFAWWGAWISQNPRSIILHPNRWFLKLGLPYHHLFPPRWTSISID